MKETAHKLKSLTAFDISGDYLIGQFERLASDDEETAIDAYTNIARYLLTNDITLADYLRELCLLYTSLFNTRLKISLVYNAYR